MSTYSGSFDIVNEVGYPITNVSVEHQAAGQSTRTLTVAEMADGVTSSGQDFSTETTSKDYWYVSFLDNAQNLITGQVTQGFSSSGSSTVSVVLKRNQVTVVANEGSTTENYNQK